MERAVLVSVLFLPGAMSPSSSTDDIDVEGEAAWIEKGHEGRATKLFADVRSTCQTVVHWDDLPARTSLRCFASIAPFSSCPEHHQTEIVCPAAPCWCLKTKPATLSTLTLAVKHEMREDPALVFRSHTIVWRQFLSSFDLASIPPAREHTSTQT